MLTIKDFKFITKPKLPGSKNATWANSRDRLLAAGFRKLDEDQLPELQEGMRVVRNEYIQDPARDDYAIGNHSYEPIPEPIDPLPDMIQTYGQKVAELNYLLGLFDLEMPITMDAAAPAVHAKCKEDLSLTPDGVMLLSVYNELRAALTNEEIVQIGAAITEAE